MISKLKQRFMFKKVAIDKISFHKKYKTKFSNILVF